MTVFSLVITFILSNNQSKVTSNGEALSDRSSTFKGNSALNRLITAQSVGNVYATRINREQALTEVTACVVDPALIECEGVGIAAFLLSTLDFIFLCNVIGNTTPTVVWRNCFSGCSKDPRVNSWKWYFEPVNQGIETKAKKVICPLSKEAKISEIQPDLRPVFDNSFRDRSNVEGYRHSTIITLQERLRVNHWLKRFVRPNTRIKQKVDDFFKRHLAGNTLLGVHVRGTDHGMEAREGKLPALSHWINNAASIFQKLPKPRKIFIASDNAEVITEFLNYFGQDEVFFTEATRAKRYHGVPPHFIQVQHNPDQFHKALGTQVLVDILLLAKCDHFLHIESSVAALASYFNPHMKSHFLDDTPRKLQDSHMKPQTESEEPTTEEPEVIEMFKRCFVMNSRYSSCTNVVKGIYVNLTTARNFIRD